VAKAKLLNQMIQSIATGNREIFKQSLESVVTIFSREARISDAQIGGLRRTISAIQLDQNKDDSKILSTGDVAKKLGVSNQAIINWIETGKIKAHRSPGGHYRIPVEQFRTTDEQDATSEAIFEKLWAKRAGMPPIDENDLGDL
jgi:excisionase family DNA binding protein